MRKIRKKPLIQEEFEKTFEPEEKLVFQTTSPFSKITDPKGAIFFASHWNQPTVRGTTGTTYVCCAGDFRNPIKFYGYYLRLNPDRSGTILDIKKPDLGYHHVRKIEDIPSFIKDQASPEILIKIGKILDQKLLTETSQN